MICEKLELKMEINLLVLMGVRIILHHREWQITIMTVKKEDL